MDKKEYWFFGIIICLLIAILCLVIFKGNKKEETENTYDVSMMHQVGIAETLSLFSSKKTYVLYVGRSTCTICEKLLPTLQQAQINNDYITQYLDITTIDRSSDDWATLVEKLDIKTTASISETEDSEAEKVTNTYGYFLDKYGFTPTVIIISNGKQKAGFVGNKTLSDFNAWLKENGV
jgi:thioredoxin-related protein